MVASVEWRQKSLRCDTQPRFKNKVWSQEVQPLKIVDFYFEKWRGVEKLSEVAGPQHKLDLPHNFAGKSWP